MSKIVSCAIRLFTVPVERKEKCKCMCGAISQTPGKVTKKEERLDRRMEKENKLKYGLLACIDVV